MFLELNNKNMSIAYHLHSINKTDSNQVIAMQVTSSYEELNGVNGDEQFNQKNSY